MILPLLEIFDLFRESDSKESPYLTEERIYSYTAYLVNGKYDKVPLLSGSIFREGVGGYVPDLRDNKEKKKHKSGDVFLKNGINFYKNRNEGCITIVADGVYAGYSFYRAKEDYPVFCLNASCSALFKKDDKLIQEKYEDYEGLNLEWFNLKYHNFLRNLLRGEGVKHMTKTILESLEDIEIPTMEEQEKEIKELKELSSIKNNFDNVKNKIELILSKEVNGYEVKIEDDFFEIFDMDKGSSGFTDEKIYQSIEPFNDKKIPVFGGEKTHRKADRFAGENAKNKKGKKVKYFNGECLIISLDGSAGCMTYKGEGTIFTLNHHAGILKLKEKYSEEINLKWFKYSYQNTLMELAVSKKSSRTLSKSILNETIITAPKRDVQDGWVKEIEELEVMRRKLETISNEIINLSNKSLVTN